MISFKELNSKNAEKLCELFSRELDSDDAQYLSELIYGINTECDDVEYAVCVYASCLLVRVFDMGRYFFIYPCELNEKADAVSAIDAVGEYAMREEIPLVFVDVPAHSLSSFVGYRHMDVDAEDEGCEAYRVRIKTECEIVSEIPSVTRGRVELNEICESDIDKYATLCKDENVNKYWGYRYSDDVLNPTDRYFFENAMGEFSRGVSITMAVRVSDNFAGEATIYAFDGKGGAEFAIRLLPSFQGKGLGTESVRAICDVAKSIGLVRLRSKVMKANSASISMLRKLSDSEHEQSECILFEILL